MQITAHGKKPGLEQEMFKENRQRAVVAGNQLPRIELSRITTGDSLQVINRNGLPNARRQKKGTDENITARNLTYRSDDRTKHFAATALARRRFRSVGI